MKTSITPIIMLIDDNEIDLFLNKKFLQISKITDNIISCLSAKEALEYLAKNSQDQDKLPHIILLDIQMPEINGFQFLEYFEKMQDDIQKEIAIIMLSSTLDPVDFKIAEENKHVVDVLRKPLNTDELKSILSDLIKKIAA